MACLPISFRPPSRRIRLSSKSSLNVHTAWTNAASGSEMYRVYTLTTVNSVGVPSVISAFGDRMLRAADGLHWHTP